MKASLALSTALATTASAARQIFKSLSSSDQTSLEQQLDKWKELYGPIARANGFFPRTNTESARVNGHSIDELERFHHTVQEVKRATTINPKAEFSPFNQFALMTDEEFKGMLMKSFAGQNITDAAPLPELANERASAADWSTSQCNSPVPNQGQCGSCWAFATIGAVETAHCLATGELLDLSEQQLISCSKKAPNQGCNGGNPSPAIDWLQQGVCTEESYPYKSGKGGQTGTCETSCTKKKLSIGKTKQTTGEGSLMTVLGRQPATVFVESANAVWRNYKSGIVSQCPGAQSDHAVIAVGYNDEYFKIKNSWGTEWGDKGYIYLKRGMTDKGTCNVAHRIAYPELTGSAPSSNPTPSSNQQPTESTRKPSSSAPKPSSDTPMTPSSSKPTYPTRRPFPSSFPPKPSNDSPMTPSSSKPTYPTRRPFPSSFPPKPSNDSPMKPSSSKPTYPTRRPFPSSFPPKPSNDSPMKPSSSKPTYPTRKPSPSSIVPKPSKHTPMTSTPNPSSNTPTTTKRRCTKRPKPTKKPKPTTKKPKPTTKKPKPTDPSPSYTPSPTTYAPKPTTQPSSTYAPTPSGNGVKDQLIAQTNKIRAAHGIGPVTWNDELEPKMRAWAEDCPGFTHGGPPGWQNLATYTKCESSGKDCTKVVGASWLWYDQEETFWNYDNNSCNGGWAKCGHFSNMMSPEVKSMACGWSECGNGNHVWCNYDTPVKNPKVGKITGMTKAELKASLTA
ncbi:hypothetical protein DYB36_011712 [Aphanomyces astaci]|uniref:Peptidase C1A papain C-terminal domain-containing protein n=1 Tax=Aphanomyces astaci TaxID=112090 RepID=A0A397BH14_APHAT|nr:hypothetical protein DYB36_011712 [Aphanomyces astaci]